MATNGIGVRICMGGITALWSLYPLLISHARGILLLSVATAMLAGLSWVIRLPLLAICSGAVGLCNLTLALMFTSHPPNIWTGLSAGILLLALVDGSHRFTYLRHCRLLPGVVPTMIGTFLSISGLTLATGVALGLLIVPLGHPSLAAPTTGVLIIAGACLFVGFLAMFLFYTSRWPDHKDE